MMIWEIKKYEIKFKCELRAKATAVTKIWKINTKFNHL